MTPEQPHDLAEGVDQLDPDHLPWESSASTDAGKLSGGGLGGAIDREVGELVEKVTGFALGDHRDTFFGTVDQRFCFCERPFDAS